MTEQDNIRLGMLHSQRDRTPMEEVEYQQLRARFETITPMPVTVAVKGVTAVVEAFRQHDVDVKLTQDQIILIGEGLVMFISAINNATLKAAQLAGQRAAETVQSVADANAVLKAAADSEKAR